MKVLTNRQQQVFHFIQQTIDRTHAPPTRVEIANYLGFRSVNAAETHLKALVKKGMIEIIPGTSRGIRLLNTTASTGLPLIGQVAAGEPILAIDHIEDYLHIPADLFTPTADYLLRVQGMSMQNAGIRDADLVAVKSIPLAENGEIVVARIDDFVTVKRLKKIKNGVQLIPENEAFDIITVYSEQQRFHIEGKVVGILRRSLS